MKLGLKLDLQVKTILYLFSSVSICQLLGLQVCAIVPSLRCAGTQTLMYSRQTLHQQSCSFCSMCTYYACTYMYLCISEHSLIGSATVCMRNCETRDQVALCYWHLNEISKPYKVFISWINEFMPYMATGPRAGMSYILKVKTWFSNGRLECW